MSNWLVKNMDPLNENIVSLLQNSSDHFTMSIWKDGKRFKTNNKQMWASARCTFLPPEGLRTCPPLKFTAW